MTYLLKFLRSTWPQRASEAVVQAAKVGVAGVGQVQVGEELPDGDGEAAHERVLDLAEPAHEAGQGDARDAVGEEEVEVFLVREPVDEGAGFHGAVTGFG